MKKVLLLHGFARKNSDMRVLGDLLAECGLECTLLDLPLTYKPVEYSAAVLEKVLDELIPRLKADEKVSLVGHSTGGLVIRKFLTDTKHLDRVNRCVLIAAPNGGSRLADLAGSYARFSLGIFQTLKSLMTANIPLLNLLDTSPEVGAIAGNNNNLFLGRWLRSENDGRVEVQSVYYEGLKDFIVLPYGHMDIHYQPETARYVYRFLRYGTFQ
ncbi:alpha/beta fold hydrolase [Paenibacillus caui]|uniref:alpha/beta fold hydrolase n=1 Tax=Paenibacillus caui TaxID=2873927 RepID=UPI001CA840BD|nr:alpha/beta fold hydrolase [Paenibacillus caui]